MNLYLALNTTGLTFDIIGVIILFKYGLIAELQRAVLGEQKLKNDLNQIETKEETKDISKSRMALFAKLQNNDLTPKQIKEAEKNISKSRLALYCIILGFIFQLSSNVLQML